MVSFSSLTVVLQQCHLCGRLKQLCRLLKQEKTEDNRPTKCARQHLTEDKKQKPTHLGSVFRFSSLTRTSHRRTESLPKAGKLLVTWKDNPIASTMEQGGVGSGNPCKRSRRPLGRTMT
jgi:hypothetical protein